MKSYTREDVVNAVNVLTDICHGASVDGGWWHDPITGEPLTKNKLEQLMLINTETSEVAEGVRKGLPDAHLPQYSMEAVEMGDTICRCFDYIGGNKLDTANALYDKLQYNKYREDHKLENRLKEGGKKC